MKVILAEKPSVARDLARVLKATTKKKGYFEGKGFVVTWTFGHLVELEAPEHYNPAWKRWSLDTLPMIPDAFALRPRGDDRAQAQLTIIRSLFEEADELICATDAGREGELIFRYIQSWAGCADKPFRRLWIRSMTDKAIKEGFRSLRDGSSLNPLYQAARCRSEADWIVGLNATRFFTLKYRQRDELWSVGRVQTPVLAMIVQRDQEIEQFHPRDYWELFTRYRETRFLHEAGRIDERETADALLARVVDHELEMVDINRQQRSIQPPPLFDLTELQREMNKRHGLTAERTLKAAQDLYERKCITYPRTDSRYLSSDLAPKLGPLLESLRAIRPEHIAPLDLNRLPLSKRIVDDAKVSDHHAIIPTEETAAGLTGDLARVYEAVVTRFIAAFYPPCRKDQTTVKAVVNREPFKATGTVIADPGWQALYPHLMKEAAPKPRQKKEPAAAEGERPKAEENQVLPIFVPGERGPHRPEIKTCQTRPPLPFTESSLLQMMETAGKQVDTDALREALKEKGLGTPATRASIIETLIERAYVIRNKKQIRSTESGRTLIRIVGDERLKSPELTGEWELQLKRIEQAAGDPDRFIADVAEYTRRVLEQSASAPPPPAHLGACPLCGADVIEGHRGYGCSRWKSGCRFVLWKDQFGARLSSRDAEQLLRHRQTQHPLPLEINGQRIAAALQLAEDGSVKWIEAPAPAIPAGLASVGRCPRCGSAVVEGKKGFGCSNYRNGCSFVIWKTLAHRRISKTMARTLLNDGITPCIQQFKSKQGKRFDARLKLVNGEVKFDFTPIPSKK